MQKYLAVAALCVASFVTPTQAAPALSDAEANCLIFPVFKKECWELGAERAAAVPVALSSAAAAATGDVKVPLIWNCSRAPAGSGHLLDC